jgi:hypothetical protein
MKLSETDANRFSSYFDSEKNSLKLKKFVPASGAASRMFKFLSEFLNEFDPSEESINAYINRKNDQNLSIFLVGVEKLPFFDLVLERTKQLFPEFDLYVKQEKEHAFIKTMLSETEFDFSNKPKAILPFHKYDNYTATAIEEHLLECVNYASSNGEANLHFTVSEEHQQSFEEIINVIQPKIEKHNNTKFTIRFSFQNQSTDALAVTPKNKPFRDENNQLIFRPGGHGALINNLNALDADVIFVKNIDNVIQNHIETISLYKKALAGILLELQNQIFAYLRKIKSNQISDNLISEMLYFAKNKLGIEIIENFDKFTIRRKV